MKLSVPLYYKSFKCIADRCRHSCCIGWEIDVDSATMEKYRTLNEGYGKDIIDSIEAMSPIFVFAKMKDAPTLTKGVFATLYQIWVKNTFVISAAPIRAFITIRKTARRQVLAWPARRLQGSFFQVMIMTKW